MSLRPARAVERSVQLLAGPTPSFGGTQGVTRCGGSAVAAASASASRRRRESCGQRRDASLVAMIAQLQAQVEAMEAHGAATRRSDRSLPN